jgi:DNA-binding LytR/AlgR family response regulator
MDKISILLVEDATHVEIAIKDRLLDMGFEVVDVLSSPSQVEGFVENTKVDIILSDIFSKESYTGLNMAKDIKQQFGISTVILNGEDNLKLNFSHNLFAHSLLSKPVKDNDLIYAIYSSQNIEDDEIELSTKAKKSKSYIFVRADYRLNKIRVNDIYYLEAKKDYVTINTTDNVYTVHATMKDMIKVLPEDLFIRTHRSYIVNIDKIFSIKYPEILIEHKMKTIPIGGLYRKDLFNRINVI